MAGPANATASHKKRPFPSTSYRDGGSVSRSFSLRPHCSTEHDHCQEVFPNSGNYTDAPSGTRKGRPNAITKARNKENTKGKGSIEY